jgi:predicted RNase H-like nuclease (RuvC/YqgF family)
MNSNGSEEKKLQESTHQSANHEEKALNLDKQINAAESRVFQLIEQLSSNYRDVEKLGPKVAKQQDVGKHKQASATTTASYSDILKKEILRLGGIQICELFKKQIYTTTSIIFCSCHLLL